MGLPGRRHGLIRQANLLHCGNEAHRRHADPAPFLGYQHAQQSKFAHLPKEIRRTFGAFPGRRSPVSYLVAGEPPAQVDQVTFSFGQREVHRPRLGDRSVHIQLSRGGTSGRSGLPAASESEIDRSVQEK